LKLTDSPAGGYVSAGRSLYFNKNGTLWTCDGTPEGTAQAKAFVNRFPGAPTIITSLGDRIFASVSGSLWVTSTSADAPAISLGAPAPNALIDVAGHAMFFVNGGLWTTDGTPAGTHAVVPALGESVSNGTAVMGGLLYFGTFHNPDSASGPKLWKSDGTFEGTVPVKVFSGNNLANLVATGRNLFFTLVNNGGVPAQLWVSDGTDAGTRVLLAAPAASLAATGHGVVFTAGDATNGIELWGSDGTPDGTHFLRDIYPGVYSSSPSHLTSFDAVVYFTAYDDVHSGELWTTDGTTDGTKLVADIEPGSGSSNPQQFVRAGDHLFFTASTTATGNELWALPLASTPGLAIGDTRVTEGDSGTTTARFTVTLSRSSAQTVTVNYASSDGSATAGSDYDATSGTLTFAPGDTSKNIDVVVHGDTIPENNETFLITLSNATGATLTKPLGFGIIDDDDQYADVALALDFTGFGSHDVVAVASNNGPRTATTLKVQHTVTPDYGPYCLPCLSPPPQLATGATAHVFDYQEYSTQQYLTATVTARQPDPLPSNNSVGWMSNGPLAMDALYLTPGAHATVWLNYFQGLPAVNMESSNPAVLSVPASGTTQAGVSVASFIANGLSIGTATIRVFTASFTIGTLTVDVVAPGTKPRWPGAVNVQPGNSISFDQPVDFSISNGATAPYTAQTATGLVTISANGQELGRTTLPLTSGVRHVPVYLPVVGATAGTVDYTGDANFLPMSTPWTLIAPRGYVTIASRADRSGATATIHLRLTGSPAAAPSGTVSVSEPGVIPATQATLTAVAGVGQADVTLTNVTPGQHTFVVNYSGDARYNGGTQNVRLLEEHRHVGPH
jgi:ELWxxDGT repeat protein